MNETKQRHERLNVAEGKPWYRPRCLSCDRALSDRDARHGYQTCDRCAQGHAPSQAERGR